MLLCVEELFDTSVKTGLFRFFISTDFWVPYNSEPQSQALALSQDQHPGRLTSAVTQGPVPRREP